MKIYKLVSLSLFVFAHLSVGKPWMETLRAELAKESSFSLISGGPGPVDFTVPFYVAEDVGRVFTSMPEDEVIRFLIAEKENHEDWRVALINTWIFLLKSDEVPSTYAEDFQVCGKTIRVVKYVISQREYFEKVLGVKFDAETADDSANK